MCMSHAMTCPMDNMLANVVFLDFLGTGETREEQPVSVRANFVLTKNPNKAD